MKNLFACLLLCVCTASAQTTVSEVLAQGFKKPANEKAAVSDEDQKALMTATATLLGKHMTFRADGTTSAFYTFSGKQSIEWKKFVASNITIKSVSEADKLNGITKKYSVFFGCDAHRAWNAEANQWGEWKSNSFPDFPLGVVFQFKSGAWTPESPALLKYFTPGPGVSISNPKAKSAGSDALPPGMQKAK
jgi:hypothetical protein